MELELEQAPMPGKQRRQTGLEERPAKLPRLGGKGQRQGASGTLSTKTRSNQRGSQRGAPKENGSASSSDEVAQMKSLLQAIGRLCLRNEDAINMFSQDTRLVMCCGTGDSGLPASLYKVAQAWKDRKEAGAAALSLRVTLMMAVFAETLSRCQAVHNSASDTQQAKDQEILTAQGHWPYLLWDGANQRHIHNEGRAALKPTEVP